MWLPAPFCETHLPTKRSAILLEDESGNKYQADYEYKRKAFTSGWKNFVMLNELLVRDVLVFHLIAATTLKVYIIRGNDFKKGVRPGVQYLSDAPRRSSYSNVIEKRKGGPIIPLPSRAVAGQPRGQLRRRTNDNDEAIEFRHDHRAWDSGGALSFEKISNFQNFQASMNELLRECRLSEKIQWSYYDVCRSRNMFLHGHLVNDINPYLTAGGIAESVRISEAIRACTLLTSEDELMSLVKGLKALEALGMNVGFLHARVQRLWSLVLDSESVMDKKKYEDACSLRDATEDEIKKLNAKLTVLRRVSDAYSADIETLKAKAKNHELKFMEEVSAAWLDVLSSNHLF